MATQVLMSASSERSACSELMGFSNLSRRIAYWEGWRAGMSKWKQIVFFVYMNVLAY